MKNNILQLLSKLSCAAALLTACNGQIVIEPSPTVIPTPTEMPTPTATLRPTETAIPQPASLTGTIFLSSEGAKPFVSSVELRQTDGFLLIGESGTDSNGVYKIENVDPGPYELWVLITTESKMISGCSDVAPPDDSWKIGIKFDEDKALSMENAHLSKALLLMANMPSSSDLKAEGFFAVLEEIKIESGTESKMDVTLICI